jgi:hypothetical protein
MKDESLITSSVVVVQLHVVVSYSYPGTVHAVLSYFQV